MTWTFMKDDNRALNYMQELAFSQMKIPNGEATEYHGSKVNFPLKIIIIKHLEKLLASTYDGVYLW